jgi:hypothetical protein
LGFTLFNPTYTTYQVKQICNLILKYKLGGKDENSL